DTGLSYNVVGMLMGRMEKAVEQAFSSTHDRLDRTYRLGIADLREELNQYLSNIAAQIPDSDPRIGEILLGAAEKYFPDWPIRSELPRSVAATHTRLQKINWRGTERQGLLLHSERVRGPKYHALNDSEEDAAISQKLPNFQEPFPTEEAATSSGQDLTGARGASGEIEWILWMEPIGLTEEEVSKIKPQRPTEVHWLPSSPSGEKLTQINKILARHLTDKS